MAQHTSLDSSVTLHPPLDENIENQIPSQPPRAGDTIEKDRALFADPEKKALLSAATRTDLSESIGTLLSGIQLSALRPEQLDELALLVSERGVVFFRNQDLSLEKQVRIIQHYGAVYDAVRGEQLSDTMVKYDQQQSEWHQDTTFKINQSKYSLLRVEKEPNARAEAAWVSQYGLYDALSKHMQRFLDGLSVVQATGHQSCNRPAVRTHPVTGWKALNVTPGSVAGFAELKKKESDKLLEILDYHLHSEAEHSMRWMWEGGSVAMWDNRCTAYRHITNAHLLRDISTKTTCLGENPYLDLASESREERTLRLEKDAKEETERLEVIKARFNNTPLRRILSRQMDRHTAVSEHRPVSPPDHRNQARADSVLSETDCIPSPPAVETSEERTERWTQEVHDDFNIRKRMLVQKSNTPLRRILQRQLSSLQRTVDWR